MKIVKDYTDIIGMKVMYRNKEASRYVDTNIIYKIAKASMDEYGEIRLDLLIGNNNQRYVGNWLIKCKLYEFLEVIEIE